MGCLNVRGGAVLTLGRRLPGDNRRRKGDQGGKNVYPAKARNLLHVSVPRHGRSLRFVEDRELGQWYRKTTRPIAVARELTGGESRWQLGRQCKNKGAPDSIESGRPSISPPPKAAQHHRMLHSSLEEWLQCATAEMSPRLTIAMLMLDIETEWTLNASLTTSSSYRKCSKRRILGHSAQATSRLRIEGTTKCSRIARGSGSGSSLGFAADLRLQ